MSFVYDFAETTDAECSRVQWYRAHTWLRNVPLTSIWIIIIIQTVSRRRVERRKRRYVLSAELSLWHNIVLFRMRLQCAKYFGNSLGKRCTMWSKNIYTGTAQVVSCKFLYLLDTCIVCTFRCAQNIQHLQTFVSNTRYIYDFRTCKIYAMVSQRFEADWYQNCYRRVLIFGLHWRHTTVTP